MKYAFAFLFTFIIANAFASIDVYNFDSEQKRLDFIELTKELRCPKCQNQDIADSNAPIAADMRKEVHRLLDEGQDKASIIQYMVDRFGDFVTYKPKMSAETYLLWYGPWLLIVLGILVILVLVRKNKPKTYPQSNTEDINRLLAKHDK